MGFVEGVDRFTIAHYNLAVRVHEWKDIEHRYTHKLLLGNGASIAVCETFRYHSLYEEARSSGRIHTKLHSLFKEFNTTDFEHILRLLLITKRINGLVGIRDNHTSRLYRSLRDALIGTIIGIHPKHEDVKDFLLPIARFMKRFDTVLSLNYDLLVYWAMLRGNDSYGRWFKDGFVNDRRFQSDYGFLREPREATGATLVFYPHGNLILATDFWGDEMKLSREEERFLLDTILHEWKQGDYAPLFVSEGNSEDKLRAIRQSKYLDTVYHDELGGGSESLVIYGWSIRDEDEHVRRTPGGEPLAGTLAEPLPPIVEQVLEPRSQPAAERPFTPYTRKEQTES